LDLGRIAQDQFRKFATSVRCVHCAGKANKERQATNMIKVRMSQHHCIKPGGDNRVNLTILLIARSPTLEHSKVNEHRRTRCLD
jgi:hypothetical protein